MFECGLCGATILDELLEGEKIDRPREVFHLECYAEAEEAYQEGLDDQESDRRFRESCEVAR